MIPVLCSEGAMFWVVMIRKGYNGGLFGK